MKRARWLAMGAALPALLMAATTALSAPAPVDKSALAQVPASSPVVFYLHGVEGTKDRLFAMLQNALPDVLPKIKPQLETWLTDGIKGHKLRGLAKNGPIFLALTDMPKPMEEPKMAFIIAVTDYKAFRDGLLSEDERKAVKDNGAGVESATMEGKPVYFVNKKNYAIVTPTEDVATEFTKKRAGLAGRISKAQATKFLAADVGVYVGMDMFNKAYGEQIKQVREKAEEAVKQLAELADKSQQATFKALAGMVGPLFQAVEDSQGILATFEFRPAGLAFHAETELRAGSPTATALKDFKVTSFADLGRLPRGRMFYSAIQGGGNLYRLMSPLMVGAAGEPDSDTAKATKAALESLVKAKPGARYDALSYPPAGLSVMHFADPAKAIKAQLELVKAMPVQVPFKSKPVIKPGAEKYGDFEFTSVRIDWDWDKLAEKAFKDVPEAAQDGAKEGFKKFFGQSMHYWLGTDGKVVLQVTAKDWATAKRLLDQHSKDAATAGGVAGFKATRKELPAEASFVALVDVVRLAHFIVGIAKPLLPAAAGPLPPAFPAPLDKNVFTYFGVAGTLTAQRGSFDLFVSAASVNQIYNTFVKPVMNMD